MIKKSKVVKDEYCCPGACHYSLPHRTGGIIFPLLPGIPPIWVGMLLYGLMTGFQTLSATIIQGLLAVASWSWTMSPPLGSRYFGGKQGSTWGRPSPPGGLLLLSLGLFLDPSWAFIAELIHTQEPVQSLRSGVGALLGFWGGLPLKQSWRQP